MTETTISEKKRLHAKVLTREQGEDAKKKEWCVTEIGKGEKDLASKQEKLDAVACIVVLVMIMYADMYTYAQPTVTPKISPKGSPKGFPKRFPKALPRSSLRR